MPTVAGRLLVASPLLTDDNFAHSVVFMVSHSEDGAMGVIVNRPLAVSLGEVWVDCPEHMADARCCAEGGPVGRDMALMIHNDDGLEGAVTLNEGLAIGGDREALIAASRDPATGFRARLFLGHAGWAPGQLEGELQRGGWLLRRAHRHWVLDPGDPQDLWQDLVNCGGPLPDGSHN